MSQSDIVTVKDAVFGRLRPATQPSSIDSSCEMTRLFAKHRADKCTEHGPLYQRLLERYRNKVITLLEIGVNKGGSLEAFAEFLPRATLYAIDRELKHTSDVAQVFYGDQADPEFLKDVVDTISTVDVVIDDGGHKGNQQQESFKALWPIVTAYYVIEDLYVCEKPNFKIEGYPTTLEFIDSLDLNTEFHRCQGFDRDVCVMRK